jgi:hypothetical protein
MKEILCFTVGGILTLYTAPIWMGALVWFLWSVIWFWACNFLQVTFGSAIIVLALIFYNTYK